MTNKLLVGLDGAESGGRALTFAKNLAGLIGDCEIVVAYVIEWSPFTFQTPEENEKRHLRREEELKIAHERILDPALAQLSKDGFKASGVVRHGDVAGTLDKLAQEAGANQIIVARASEGGFAARIFGSATSALVMKASVPVTVVE